MRPRLTQQEVGAVPEERPITPDEACAERLTRARVGAEKAAKTHKSGTALEPAIAELQDAVFEAEDVLSHTESTDHLDKKMIKDAKMTLTSTRATWKSMFQRKR